MRIWEKKYLWIMLCAVMVIGLGLLLMTPAVASADGVHFSIPEGEYDGPQTVVLTCDEGWKVCYTTDGTSPKVDNYFGYKTPNFAGNDNPVVVSINKSSRITAVAYREKSKQERRQSGDRDQWEHDLYVFSPVVSQAYQIQGTGVIVGNLLFSLPEGTYTGEQEITLTAPDGWNICYRTDGEDPLCMHPIIGYRPSGYGFCNPVTLSIQSNCSVKAVIYSEELKSLYFGIYSQNYKIIAPGSTQDIQFEDINFSPGGGDYEERIEIKLSAPAGWKISYTTDGSSPIDENSENFEPIGLGNSNPVTLTVSDSCTIRAVAYQYQVERNIYTFSDIAEQTYRMIPPGTTQVGEINFSPGGGVYDESQEITLTAHQGWKISYTTDGSSPIDEMSKLKGPIGLGNSNPVTLTVSDSCTIRAVAYQREMTTYTFSEIAEQTYRMIPPGTTQVGEINFSPGGGVYDESQEITLTALPGWKISYTTDGSSPIDEYSEDFGPIGLGNSNPVTLTVSDSCTIRAVAYQYQEERNIYTFSEIAEQTYRMIPPGTTQVGEINFSPGGGVYDESQEITLTALPGWKISYTTDGSSPIDEMSKLNGPIGLGNSNPVTLTVSDSCTIRAVAYQYQEERIIYTFSEIAGQIYINSQSDYTLELTAPEFDDVFTNYDQPEAKPLIITSSGSCDATITSVSLSGPNADCFTLNRTGGAAITAGSTDDSTYTIRPKAGLAAGIYMATVTVAYDGGMTARAGVSFIVNDWEAAAAPAIYPAGGAYSTVQTVELSCETEGASIYYTTDGTDPDSTVSTLYTEPILVSADTTIKAIAIKPGLRRSHIVEASYSFNLRLFYGPNMVVLAEEYKPVTFAYTPQGDGAYRFFCEDGEISPSITVWDGDDQIGYQTAEYQPNNRIAILTGGKEYTVRIESLHGTGDVTLMVYPSALYPIYAEPSAHGTVTVSQGAIPADDGNTIGMAYAGADVYFEASPEDGYGLADISVVNAIGWVISDESSVTMPWGNVTVRANFDTVHSLTWEQDEHAHFETIWINGGGMAAWGEDREVVKGQKVQLSWDCDEGYVADTFTVTTENGSPVDWTFGLDNDNHQVIEFTMPGEDVHVALTSRGFSFDRADIILPADTRTVEESAFAGDARVTSVVIPSGCTGIGKWAFKDCKNLKYIRIPEACAIGEDAFEGCGLVYIYSAAGSPAWQYCQDHEENCTFVEEPAQ